jgi:ubiquinone/menaquinone biosynthesis C-methylase UbiE
MSKYTDVINANIELHTKLSEHYNSCEPHFRIENIEIVERKIEYVCKATKARHLLDFGCGTGFIINLAKKYVDEIVGVDVTQAMMDKVDRSGKAKITLVKSDTGAFKTDRAFDVVTGYSFLHHLYDIRPTIQATYRALKPGGICYFDLDPNYYFWEQIHLLKRDGQYDPMVKREIEMVAFKDEDIHKKFNIDKEVFNSAEYGKNIAGGFKEEFLKEVLADVGFSQVDFFYYWFLGQSSIINDTTSSKVERIKLAEEMNQNLTRSLPLSRPLFKYLGFYAIK